MRYFMPLMLLPLVLGCNKQMETEAIAESLSPSDTEMRQTVSQAKAPRPATTTFTRYTIQQGAHECDQRTVKSVTGTSMNFTARFDETAKYPAIITDYNHA